MATTFIYHRAKNYVNITFIDIFLRTLLHLAGYIYSCTQKFKYMHVGFAINVIQTAKYQKSMHIELYVLFV